MEYMRGFIDRYHGSGKSGDLSWLLQRVSGVALLVLLLGHFFIEHFAGSASVLDYQHVAARLASTGWKAFDLTFVVFALYHGINGIFMVIEDYVHSGWRVFWKGFFWIVGILYLVLAAITILPFKG